MPVFANRPAICVLESGEVAALLTEPAQRSRGLSYFLDPLGKKPVFVAYETPRRREMLGWLFVTSEQKILVEPTVTPILILEKEAGKEAAPQKVHYLRHAQSLEITYCAKTKEFHVLFYWNLYTPVKQGPAEDSQDNIIQTFLSTYKTLPISWALSLGKFEPHAKQLLAPKPEFPFLVGDPPLDPGGAWPGVYNFFNVEKTLLVGSAALHKNFDPYQISDAHLNLPGTPGYVRSAEVSKNGGLISLGTIENFLNDHTQHLYHQREIQASRMSTRVLMFARGQLRNLILKEDLPERDDLKTNFQGLVVGASVLDPAIKDDSYVGKNYTTIQSNTVLYPFDASLPGFISLTPGDTGHQFQVSGGEKPYQWCLRRTRSSINDPAKEPQRSGDPPNSNPYPFDDHGNLVTDDDGNEPPFPPATQGGGMPPGMLLNQDGLFYGTPTQSGVFVFRLHVKDKNGLRGETTIRFEVLKDPFQAVPECSLEGRGEFPVVYKASVSYVDIPPLSLPDYIDTWKGRVGAVGGETQKYFFTLPHKSNPPWQQVPSVRGIPILEIDPTDGTLTLDGLTEDNFEGFTGVWVFEVRVTEYLPSGVMNQSYCDSRGVSISIGTTIVAGMDDALLLYTPDGKLPEGKFSVQSPSRPYLVLEMPKIVSSFIQGKNLYLAGSPAFPLRPDLGGVWTGIGPITSHNPGFANPTQVVGIKEDALSPAHIYQNWLNSNPTTFFKDVYDRFDPVPTIPAPPAPPETPPIEGAEIDDFLFVGKRIRPLWPI